MPFVPDTHIYSLPGFLIRYTDTAWSVASMTFQECPLPARTDIMRVYSVRLPLAAPMAGPSTGRTTVAGGGQTHKRPGMTPRTWRFQPAARTGPRGDHGSNPAPRYKSENCCITLKTSGGVFSKVNESYVTRLEQ